MNISFLLSTGYWGVVPLPKLPPSFDRKYVFDLVHNQIEELLSEAEDDSVSVIGMELLVESTPRVVKAFENLILEGVTKWL